MLKAKDIMTKDVVSVRRETPIIEAIRLLMGNEITGLPVVEDDMTLVGMLTEKKNKTVEDFMTRPAVHYNENESLQAICDFMMINYFRRVPVTSKKGKLVGIISRPDVIKHILQLSRESISVS
ncbi:MAG: CBS domain-containing protein [Planctomycetota bacterium]